MKCKKCKKDMELRCVFQQNNNSKVIGRFVCVKCLVYKDEELKEVKE